MGILLQNLVIILHKALAGELKSDSKECELRKRL